MYPSRIHKIFFGMHIIESWDTTGAHNNQIRMHMILMTGLGLNRALTSNCRFRTMCKCHRLGQLGLQLNGGGSIEPPG